MKPTNYSFKKNYPGYLLVIPTFLAIVLLAIYPLIHGISIGFKNYALVKSADLSFNTFCGFANYEAMFSQPEFWQAFKNTVVWTVSNVGLQVLLATLASLVLNRDLKFRSFFRTAALIPWAVPSVIAALVFKFIYDSETGLLNIVLRAIGVIHAPVSWLGNIETSLAAVTVESIWKGTPFVMIFILAALQGIPGELYESAAIDGANGFQTFFQVTLPLIKEPLAIATILTTIGTINNFNAIWLMTQGGPLGSSEILFTYAYRKAFIAFDFGQSSAISTIIFLMILMLTFAYSKLIVGKEGTT